MKYLIPRVYGDGVKNSNIHKLVADDNEIVSVIGNLIKEVELNGNKYKISLVGSVATTPGNEGKGYMHKLMDLVDLDNRNNDIVFSILSGYRKRYNYYGYEKVFGRLAYSFDNYFLKHYSPRYDILIDKYKKEDSRACYELYKENASVVMRSLEDFTSTLVNGYNEVLSIYYDNSLIGYLDLCNNTISELILNDYSKAIDVIYYVMNKYELNSLTINVSPLDVMLARELDKEASNSSLNDYIHIKIYELKEFLEYIIGLNLRYRRVNDLSLVYKVDNEVIEISIKDNKAKVEYTNKPYSHEFSKQELTRYIFNAINSDSPLYPLYFDVLRADMF